MGFFSADTRDKRLSARGTGFQRINSRILVQIRWLWVFASKDSTVYRVAQGRGGNIVLETLGLDYPGVLISDCVAVYDEVDRCQQECYSHHLKAISRALEEAPSTYLEELRALLKAVLALKGAALSGPELVQRRAALELGPR